MPRRKKGLSIREIVALLDNPGFCAEARAVNEKARRLHERLPTEQEWDREWPAFCKRVLNPFVRKWRVLPPPPELIATDRQRNAVFAILTGRWGFIPVFPWTKREEIQRGASKIRKAIGMVHKDASGWRKAVIAHWLRIHYSPKGLPPRNEIAEAVWGRKKGLRLPTKEEVINNLSFEREHELHRQYTNQGLSYKEAERRIYTRARGAEPRAASMVRMAEKRHEKEQEEFMAAVQAPHRLDDLGYFLTLLLREILSPSPVPQSIIGKAAFLRDQLIGSSPHR